MINSTRAKWDAESHLPGTGKDVLVWCSIARDDHRVWTWRRARFNNEILGKEWNTKDLHWELVYEPDCPVMSEFPWWALCDMIGPMLKLERLMDEKFGDRWREYMFGDVKRDGFDMVPLENGGEWVRVESGDGSVSFVSIPRQGVGVIPEVVYHVSPQETRPLRESPDWHNLAQYVNRMDRKPYGGEIGRVDKGSEYHVYCVHREENAEG